MSANQQSANQQSVIHHSATHKPVRSQPGKFPLAAATCLLALALNVAVLENPALADAHPDQALPPPTLYSAQYQARSMGMRTGAYRELTLQQDNTYELRHGLSLKLLGATLISVEERSHFQWSDGGAIPLDYRYEQGGVRSREEQISFNWDTGTASITRNGNQREAELLAGMLDNLSFTAQMSAELLRLTQQQALDVSGTSLTFTLMESNETDTQEYAVIGTETLNTDIGEIETVMLERVRDPSSERSTIFWLATDYEYTLARLEQTESNGTRTELMLESIELKPSP